MRQTNRPSAPLPISKTALLGLLLGVAATVALLAVALGYRQGWWPLLPTLRTAELAVYGATLGLLLSLVGLFLSRPGGQRRGLVMAIAGVVAALPLVVAAVQWRYAELAYPPINDVSTDLEDPPVFWEMPNPTDYPGGETATLQRAAYPDILPLRLSVPPARAYEVAAALVREEDWEVVAEDAEDGRIEAVATSFLFGFKDEIVIRVAASDGGSVVDLRSRSRLGRIDRGLNAKRIRAFGAAMRARVG